MKNELKQIKKALFKRAVGYQTDEVVEEYSLNDNSEEKLTKKKKTIKVVPPDISATKLYLDLNQTSSEKFDNLTDEELNQEIEKIISQLQKNKE